MQLRMEKKRRTVKEINKEKDKIYGVLLKKSALSIKEILPELSIELPESTIYSNNRKKGRNPEYNKKVSKYVQIHLYNKDKNERRLTLCEEGRIFRLNRDDKLWKVPAKEFMKAFLFEWEKQVHSYYFATPRTYLIKKEIFEDIIQDKILKKFEKYIEHKEKIKTLLQEAEQFMAWIEMVPNEKKELKNIKIRRGGFRLQRLASFIIDFLIERKNLTDYPSCTYLYGFTTKLGDIINQIEDLLLFGNIESAYINAYRILRRELHEKGFGTLPENYEKEPLEEKPEQAKLFEKVLKTIYNYRNKENIIKIIKKN